MSRRALKDGTVRAKLAMINEMPRDGWEGGAEEISSLTQADRGEKTMEVRR